MPLSHIDLSSDPDPAQEKGTISVLIPSYNHAPYISQALDSLLRQTRPPGEIIVVDDGSIDNTVSVVQPYLDKIRFVEQENRGVSRTLDRGLALCQGDYVLILASDDWMEPDALRLMGTILDRHPDVGVVYGSNTVVDLQGVPLSGWKQVPHPLEKCRDTTWLILKNFVTTAPLARRAALLEAGSYLDFLYCQDYAMWLRMALNGWSFYGLKEVVACYRRHPTNLTNPQNSLRSIEDIRRMLKAVRSQFEDRLTDAEKQAFAVSDRNLLRSYGWTSLWQGSPQIPRRLFLDALRSRIALPDLVGLLATFLPVGVLKRTREMVRYQQHSRLGKSLKRLLLTRLMHEDPYY